MVRTRVGYCGGTTPFPNYRRIGDHSEAIELAFDAALLDSASLLELVLREYPAPRRAPSRQYRHAIFAAGEPFFVAEDYHQKYRLRRHPDLIAAAGLDDQKLIDSTLAARLNGFVAAPSREQLEALSADGLPPRALPRLEAIMQGRF